jgi:predicted SnoaL-like aldol condensation-catalyzing enzyme
MTRTTPAHNKALVLEAFDTLFNKRDYGAFARYWSPNYLQHSAHIGPGRDGLLKLVKSLPRMVKKLMRLRARSISGALRVVPDAESGLCALCRG